jgi:hypothetical protein
MAQAIALIAARQARLAGDPQGAVEAWLAGLAAGACLTHTPHGRAEIRLIGSFAEGDAMAALGLLEPKELPTPALQALAAGLAVKPPPPHELLWGERDRTLREMASGDGWERGIAEVSDLPLAKAVAKNRVREAAAAARRVFDRRMQLMDRYDWAGLKADDEAPDACASLTQVVLPVTYLRAAIVEAALPRTSDLYAEAMTVRMAEAAARAGVAAELYRREVGHRPAALQDLVPRWLPAVPVDAFNQGAPLGFREGKLYSVGPDGRDEGGQATGPWHQAVPPEEVRGDLVLWQL